MYKVNIEDLNQFLSYHEVFGKIHGDAAASHTITALQAQQQQQQQQSSGNATITTTSSTNITTTTTSSIVTNDNTSTNAAAEGLLLPKMENPGGQQNIQNLPIDPNNPHTNQLLAPDGTPITQATHVCDICGKMFPFRYQLIVHRRYHSERKPFNCQVGSLLVIL